MDEINSMERLLLSKSATTTTTTTIASSNTIHRRQRLVQNFLLIWVDANIDQSNNDCQDTLVQLRSVVNDLNIFTQSDQCIQFLNGIDDEKAFVIASGSLGQHLVPDIHALPQVDAIFIFCDNKSRHEQWTKPWTKIKGVHTEITSICEALQLAAKQCNQDSIAMSFVTVNEVASRRNLDRLEPSFMYTQLFKEILLEMEHDEKSIRDLAKYCREFYKDNMTELTIINEFERDYRPETSIWWYTRECFTYPMLNQALRKLEADTIINMGFFIRDLHGQLEELNRKQVNSYHGQSFTLYRGQGLLKTDFEKLQKTKGGLISFNNFLSTSTDQHVSLDFANRALTRANTVGILYKMTIDPSVSSAPFASIQEVSYFQNKAEILFSMHTIFRIAEIKQIDENNSLYQVDLKLTSDDDEQLRILTNQIRDEADGTTGWERLGLLLVKIGQFDKAEELYKVLLEQTSEEREKAHYYNNLGNVKCNQGDSEKAISYHDKALEIRQKILPPNHPLLAHSYNNIARVHYNKGEYSKALSFFQKSLEIQQRILPPNHPDLAHSYNNIGEAYRNLGEYSQASSFFEKALEIRIKILPSNHPVLAMSYNNIGDLYRNIGEYSKALSFFEKTIEIAEKTLPSNHSDLAHFYNNIAIVYANIVEYSKALFFFEKALEIRVKTLPSDHSELAMSYNNIGDLYQNMREYSKALSFFEKTIEIAEKTLPSNHPDLATSYNNIGEVYRNLGEYSKAFSFFEKALEIRQGTLPPNHPHLAESYNDFGELYRNMGEYSKALSFFEKALEIQQKTLPPNHPHLASSYLYFAATYEKMGDYIAALKALQTAFEIQEKVLEEDSPTFGATYRLFGKVYRDMKDYTKSLDYFEKCLAINQKVLPEKHSDLGITLSNIGDVYRLIGKYEMALSFQRKVLNLQENVQCNPLKCATAYINLGETYREMQDYSVALTYFQQGLEIRKNKLPKNHPDIAVIYHNMAKLYLATQDYRMAMKNIEQALEIAEVMLPPNHPHLLDYKKTSEKYWKENVTFF